MTHETLDKLIDDTFGKLSCPSSNEGLYNELHKAVLAAYSLGMQDKYLEEYFTHKEGNTGYDANPG